VGAGLIRDQGVIALLGIVKTERADSPVTRGELDI